MKTSAWTLMPLLLLLCLAACRTAPPKVQDYDATPPLPPPPASEATGSIYLAGRDVPLFENLVARRVGDILTIVLAEKTDAAKSASTTTSKASAIEMTPPVLGGGALTVGGRELLQNTIENSSSFDGSGDSRQSNQLSGNLTVTVAERLPNGNLLVRGQKWIMINQGNEFVRVQGIVRPTDISPSNTVPSYKVADATISYGSRGTLAAANTKSWLARFFDSRWMPF